MERTTVTIREDQKEFMDENDINKSALLRKEIDKLMEEGKVTFEV